MYCPLNKLGWVKPQGVKPWKKEVSARLHWLQFLSELTFPSVPYLLLHPTEIERLLFSLNLSTSQDLECVTSGTGADAVPPPQPY